MGAVVLPRSRTEGQVVRVLQMVDIGELVDPVRARDLEVLGDMSSRTTDYLSAHPLLNCVRSRCLTQVSYPARSVIAEWSKNADVPRRPS